MTRTQKIGKFCMITFLVILAVVYLSPVLILINSSFKTLSEIYIDVLALPTQFSFRNYIQALDNLDFVTSFTNSLVITVVSVAFILITSSMAAWVLVRYRTKISSGLFMMFSAALLIPFQCVMLPLVDLMSTVGLMNRPGLIFMYIGFGTSMSTILYHGFIKNVPLELEEAAMLDGCSLFRTYFFIVLPLLKTITITVATINAMWIWNDFLLPQLVINKPGWQTLPLKTYLFFGQFTKKWDLATAGLVLCMIPIILFYLLGQKYIIKGVTDGAIK